MGGKQGKALLITLMGRLGEIAVNEDYLAKQAGQVVHGYTYADGSITVNPVPSTVDTVIHELLHSQFPKYSEQTVRRLTSRLMHEMTDAELQAFYAAYGRACER